jgi:multidrug efflux system membrane fusion protein
LLLVGTGCRNAAPPIAAPAIPVVPVSHPVERQVTDYVDFTGRTDAVQSVNVVARATGYLVKMPFEEGADVKSGQLLFQIDPQPYEAQVHLGAAQVATSQAQLQLANQNYERAQGLMRRSSISQQEYDQYLAARDQAAAQLQAAQANLEIYRLNLQYTHVTSPINGQVGRYFLTLGNLVNQDQTLLTTIVSLDPIYAYFDVDQRTLLRVRRAINEGKIRSRRVPPSATPAFMPEKFVASQGLLGPAGVPSYVNTLALAAAELTLGPPTIPVLLGLAGETGFPHRGTIDFANNQLNPTTGSISVRGVFRNPRPSSGVRLMSPGMFVRVRLPIGAPHPALLVIDRAIQSEQGQKFVYVVGADNKLDYRQVVTGSLQEDGLRVITSGVAATDWVVVGALQQIRPNMQVSTQATTMPSFAPATPER